MSLLLNPIEIKAIADGWLSEKMKLRDVPVTIRKMNPKEFDYVTHLHQTSGGMDLLLPDKATFKTTNVENGSYLVKSSFGFITAMAKNEKGINSLYYVTVALDFDKPVDPHYRKGMGSGGTVNDVHAVLRRIIAGHIRTTYTAKRIPPKDLSPRGYVDWLGGDFIHSHIELDQLSPGSIRRYLAGSSSAIQHI